MVTHSVANVLCGFAFGQRFDYSDVKFISVARSLVDWFSSNSDAFLVSNSSVHSNLNEVESLESGDAERLESLSESHNLYVAMQAFSEPLIRKCVK